MIPWGGLTLPERRFASFVAERQRTHQTPPVGRLQQNYGPRGIALGSAAILNGLTGSVIGCLGLLLLFVTHGSASAYLLLALAVLVEFPAMTRAIQGIYAGRQFRGERPFQK